MDISSVASTTTASQAAATRETAGMLVMRKVVDAQKTEGDMLLQLMDQSADLGQKLNTIA